MRHGAVTNQTSRFFLSFSLSSQFLGDFEEDCQLPLVDSALHELIERPRQHLEAQPARLDVVADTAAHNAHKLLCQVDRVDRHTREQRWVLE